ncbi:MAG: hypothetical protein IPM42_18135 [Saprospiraceae bacterium]|nr:hypothetical protein [Saprospiraceae bacterium]
MSYLVVPCAAQESIGTRLKTKEFILLDCRITPDTLTLLPSEVIIKDTSGVELKNYSILNNTILIDEAECIYWVGKKVIVSYRTFTFDIGKVYTGLDTTLLTYRDKALTTIFDYVPANDKNALIESKGLNYKGSFARGISVGNSQSLVLNSNFDLQLYGDLGNGLKVVAAISDENLPIQAQGNTQQLQEFDKVFIQVSKDKTSVIAGDYELRKPDSYFMNYFKKLKGINVRTEFDAGKDKTVQTSGSFAISRGKFARQFLVITEGNQGPYRLQGNNGERFLIVLAGTEKVFFNGILLKRGFDYDYIIDYNRAELIFSPTRIVARDSRVIVEFEYTDINYLRSLYTTNTAFSGEKWKVNLNIYSEQDSKTATGDIQLDSTDISILTNSGDDRSKTVRSGIRRTTTEELAEINRVLYIGIPSPDVPEGLILKFTENLDSAAYTAVFSEVQAGTGSYEIDNTKNKNARVYVYVGENAGKYRPIIQLIPPEKRQLVTLNASFRPRKNTDIYAETALSNLDMNTRSAIDNEDNTGIASHIAINNVQNLDTAGLWKFSTSVKYEFVNKNFNALNPFRAPEFVRDWNLSTLTAKGDENLFLGNVGISSGKEFNFQYGYNHFSKSDIFRGGKHLVKLDYIKNRVTLKVITTALETRSSFQNEKSSFIRPNVNFSYLLNKKYGISLGTEWDAESNLRNDLPTDTLMRNSYEYSHIKVFMGSDFEKDLAFRIAYSVREDYFSDENQLKKSADARELELSGKWKSGKNSELFWNVTARDLLVLQPDLVLGEQTRKTILGKIDYNVQLWKGAVRSSTLYNVNSGQEPKIEYIFQKVEVGQGDYFLINPSESPNLSNVQDFRFDPSNPLSDYIRLSLFNNEFIRTNNIELNQNLRIEGSKFWSEGSTSKNKFHKKILKSLSTLSSIRFNKKKMDGSDSNLISYFDFGFSDTSLVAYNSLINNTLFILKGNVKFDMQIGNTINRNRIVQVSGFEDRGVNEYFTRNRWNIKTFADLIFSMHTGERSYTSEAFGDRNLEIKYYKINPELSIRPSQTTRLSLKYIHTNRQQQILSKDKAVLNEFSAEVNLRKASKYSIDQTVSFVNIQYSGLPNSPIEYDLLEGLKNGKNFLWSLIYTKRMSTNIDLTLNYEGRKAGIQETVHVGRIQLKATF